MVNPLSIEEEIRTRYKVAAAAGVAARRSVLTGWRAGFRQEELAAAAGVSQPTISRAISRARQELEEEETI